MNVNEIRATKNIIEIVRLINRSQIYGIFYVNTILKCILWFGECYEYPSRIY